MGKSVKRICLFQDLKKPLGRSSVLPILKTNLLRIHTESSPRCFEVTLVFVGKTDVPKKHCPLNTRVKHSCSYCEGVPRWIVLVISVVPSLRQTHHLIITILSPGTPHFSMSGRCHNELYNAKAIYICSQLFCCLATV
jgi:hypothetical protein